MRGKDIVVYEPSTDPEAMDEFATMVRPGDFSANWRSDFVANAVTESQYQAVMRFTLVDPEDRMFSVHRQTYRDEGGWSRSLANGLLPDLADEYLPHLGRDSFFELM